MRKIQNSKLANKILNTIHGPVKLDDKGQADVEDHVAEHFTKIPGYTVVGEPTLKKLPTSKEDLDKLDARVKTLLIRLPQDKKAEVLNNAASIAQRAFKIAIAEKKTEDQANDSASTAYVNAIIELATKEIEAAKHPKGKVSKVVTAEKEAGTKFDPNAEIPASDLSSAHKDETKD